MRAMRFFASVPRIAPLPKQVGRGCVPPHLEIGTCFRLHCQPGSLRKTLHERHLQIEGLSKACIVGAIRRLSQRIGDLVVFCTQPWMAALSAIPSLELTGANDCSAHIRTFGGIAAIDGFEPEEDQLALMGGGCVSLKSGRFTVM
jgi:hypothetical protein